MSAAVLMRSEGSNWIHFEIGGCPSPFYEITLACRISNESEAVASFEKIRPGSTAAWGAMAALYFIRVASYRRFSENNIFTVKYRKTGLPKTGPQPTTNHPRLGVVSLFLLNQYYGTNWSHTRFLPFLVHVACPGAPCCNDY